MVGGWRLAPGRSALAVLHGREERRLSNRQPPGICHRSVARFATATYHVRLRLVVVSRVFGSTLCIREVVVSGDDRQTMDRRLRIPSNRFVPIPCQQEIE